MLGKRQNIMFPPKKKSLTHGLNFPPNFAEIT